jgi:uncharacterized protein with HEPN domain
MMETAAALADIVSEIDSIEAAASGRSLQDFKREWQLKRAIGRGLEIISEAPRRIPTELRDTRPDVPWKQVFALGNLLRHEYHRTDDEIIWRVATRDLAGLRSAATAMLAGLRDEQS